jgi:peptide/nickel transport system permease protein
MGERWGYLGRRVASALLVVVLTSMLIFALLYVSPGSPEEAIAGPKATPEYLAQVRAEYGLDDSLPVQYVNWVGNAVTLDLGRSFASGEKVSDAVASRFPVSLQLGLMGFLIAVGLAVPLGVLAAVRGRSTTDRAVVALAVVGVSAPAFATGLFLLYVFGLKLGWFPLFGEGSSDPLDRLWHLTLPAIAVALTGMAPILKLTRAGTAEALERDYISFARVRGVSPRRVLTAHALRNALLPVITIAAGLLGFMITGIALVEVTFSINGLGALLVTSVTQQDVPTVQGITLLVTIVVVVVNIATDLLYMRIDPRISLTASSR